ncbi:ATPase-like, ParA/MinD [Denitrovibrio acetiphilus DSM 12809]|uniref:Iron-sulfur cluster carrier protein n=1 Tax=Denitrovibrio acetiphilus (strain DSM 12809 / NBRC 114555 / N2460) TaxID=522772 RepID=D4H1A6_DENA2|nr:Mrp/NBP35 family ATP-binding protein [Denitrovibrio acetiphilus]ADD66854.1 ATPase-like, ParA/MinD [Denitrovibrio acetiphilus DSM 12809]
MSSCNSDSSCNSCGSQSSCDADEKRKHTQEMLTARLSKIKYKIMVMSGKGGVGKSTVSVSLASALHSLGFSVGILDADIHGPNIPKMFGMTQKGVQTNENGLVPFEAVEGLKVMSVGFLVRDDDDAVIWRAPVKHGMIEQFMSEVEWGDLDFLIIDLPPGTGDEPLSVAHTIGKGHVDGCVVVTTPQEVALLDSRKSITFARKLDIPVFGIVENMSGLVCPHCGETVDLFKSGGGEKAAGEMDVNFLGRVPIDPMVVVQGDSGKPYVLEVTDTPTAAAFKSIAENILSQTIKAEK